MIVKFIGALFFCLFLCILAHKNHEYKKIIKKNKQKFESLRF